MTAKLVCPTHRDSLAAERIGPHRPALPLAAAALFALLAAVWLRPPPLLLYGVDAACYARVAREMAARPLSSWPRITLGGEAFFEHPPLAFWLESLAFRAGGASAATAVTFARALATLLGLVVLVLANRLAGLRIAAFALASMLLLSGFLYESQNPMLELPLTLALACGVLGTVLLNGRAKLWGLTLFALGFTAAFFFKGPPALALFPVVLWHGWRTGARRAALRAVAIAIATAVAAALFFEWARARQGLTPFFPEYLHNQVLRSALQGRHHPERSFFYYLRPLLRWYLPALIGFPLSVWAWTRACAAGERAAGERRLIELGWVVVAVIVGGFSIPVQKYDWYIHPVMLGAALFLGPALAALIPARFNQTLAAIACVLVVGATCWLRLRPAALSAQQQELSALQAMAPPFFAPGERRTVAHCGSLSPWMARHLFAFSWDAAAVACDAAAPVRFDGARLVRVP